MKRLKSLMFTFLFVVAAVTLVACGDNQGKKDIEAVAEAKESLEIVFTDLETSTTVRNKLTLTDKVNDVLVEWVSDKPTVVSATGTVTRPDVDTEVTLTATLTKGEAKDTKEFKVTVIKKAEKGSELITEHYKETILKPGFVVTEDLDLIDEIGEYEVTWEVVSGAEYMDKTGKVLKNPTFTEGNQSVSLRATMTDGTSKTFILPIQAAEETTDEKIVAALAFVTIKPSGEFQTSDFVAPDKVEIDGTEVTVTWTTSDEKFMTKDGKLSIFESDNEFEEVTLTASITFEGVTKTKDVTFKVKPTTVYEGFKEALDGVDNKKGVQVFVSDVTLYKKISGGYYLASTKNDIIYINGNAPSELKTGKVYNVIATTDIYNGSIQLKSPTYRDERNGSANVITPRVTTLADYLSKTPPTEANPVHSEAIVLSDVKVMQTAAGGNYDTYLVDNSQTTAPTEKTAALAYYNSDIAVLRSIVDKNIGEIEIIAKGYRTDKKYFYFDFIGKVDDIKLNLTPEEEVSTAEGIAKSLVKKDVFENTDLKLPETIGKTNVVWTSSNTDVITNKGVVTIPTDGIVEVTLTVTITSNEDKEITNTITIKTKVGEPEELTIAEFLTKEKGVYAIIKGKIVGYINNDSTFIIQDNEGNNVAFRALRDNNPELGDNVRVVVMKDVFNGLIQAAAQTKIATHEDVITTQFVDLNNEDLSNENLEKFQASLIKLNNMYVKSFTTENYGNVEMVLVRLSDGQEISFKWDSRIKIDGNISPTLKVGDVINIVGAPLGWANDKATINQSLASEVVKANELTDIEKLDAAKVLLSIETDVKSETNIGLVATGIFGATVTWEFKDATNTNNALINLETGLVKLPAEVSVVTVTLTATIKLGDKTVTKDFVVTIEKRAELTSLALFDFTKMSGKKGGLISSGEELVTLFNSVTENKTLLVSAEGLERIYQGNGTGGGAFENSEKVLKTGTGSVKGTMKLTFAEEITKIKLTLAPWTTSDKVTINGVDSGAIGTAFKLTTITIDLEKSSKILDFTFSNRVLIENIELF